MMQRVNNTAQLHSQLYFSIWRYYRVLAVGKINDALGKNLDIVENQQTNPSWRTFGIYDPWVPIRYP